jgi:hypothetical protein
MLECQIRMSKYYNIVNIVVVFCGELITRPEESYRLWRVVVRDQETSKPRRLKPATGLWKYNHNGL